MKLLAVKWRRLGDTVLWSSALAALRERFPAAQIDIAYPGAYAPLFAADPRFDRKLSLPLSIWRDVRPAHYDSILVFHANGRAARIALLGGAKQRVIHSHDRRGKNLFSHVRIPDLGQPMAATQRDLNVVRALGWKGDTPATKIFPAPAPLPDAIAALARPELPLVVLGPSASRPAKQWPLGRFAEVARALRGKARVVVVFDDERPLRERGMSHFDWYGAQLLHTPKLETLMAILAAARVYVGSDSGAKHLAVALGTRTVTLFGPESIGEWHGYSEKQHPTLQRAALCRANDAAIPRFAWCGVQICPYASHMCMTLIPVDEVVATVSGLLI